MATNARGNAPALLWIVGLLALLWNAYGCYEYLMTVTVNEAFLAKQPASWITYWEALPVWLVAFWALGVWGGLAGAVLLLMRSRYAVWAFAVSLIGIIVDLGSQMVMTDMPAGMLGMIDWVIVIVAAFLLWYSWSEERKGVLR